MVKIISIAAEAIATAGIDEKMPKTELANPWIDFTIFNDWFNPADWIENINWLIDPNVLVIPFNTLAPTLNLFNNSSFCALYNNVLNPNFLYVIVFELMYFFNLSLSIFLISFSNVFIWFLLLNFKFSNVFIFFAALDEDKLLL